MFKLNLNLSLICRSVHSAFIHILHAVFSFCPLFQTGLLETTMWTEAEIPALSIQDKDRRD